MTATTKANAGFGPGVLCAIEQKHKVDHTPEKTLATIRAKLCIAGGQTLHVAEGGAYFVTTPWQQITKLDDLQSLQAYVAKVGA